MEYLINTENGNILLDQIRQYVSATPMAHESSCYHALLFGIERHQHNKIANIELISAILDSLKKLKGYVGNIDAQKHRAVFMDSQSAFKEVEKLYHS